MEHDAENCNVTISTKAQGHALVAELVLPAMPGYLKWPRWIDRSTTYSSSSLLDITSWSSWGRCPNVAWPLQGVLQLVIVLEQVIQAGHKAAHEHRF